MGGRESEQKKISVLYRLVWKYFNYPAATEMRKEREAINPERRFHRLIWEAIVSYVGDHKGKISTEYIFYYLLT